MKNDVNNTRNIALIDDDLTLYSELEEQKDFNHDYSWQHFISIVDFNHKVGENIYDLVLLNGLGSGIENKEKILYLISRFPQLPIIALSSKKEATEGKIKYGEFGNITFIEKPFSLINLLTSVSHKLRYQEASRFLSVRVGSYLLKPYENVILDDFGSKLKLTDTEVKILKILFKYKRGGVKKEVVMEEVWGIKDFNDTHTLETHIYRLRKKMKSVFEDHLSIKSKPGSYAIIANNLKASNENNNLEH